jgi:hypothetical protein
VRSLASLAPSGAALGQSGRIDQKINSIAGQAGHDGKIKGIGQTDGTRFARPSALRSVMSSIADISGMSAIADIGNTDGTRDHVI